MYQRYRYDVLADEMADEYTLYGGLLSLDRLAHTDGATPIRDAYVDLEKEIVEGFMGPELGPEVIETDGWENADGTPVNWDEVNLEGSGEP
jgi:hypothetical protein